MKFLKQFAVIITISFLAEGIKFLLPLPIPASIYGLALMLLALCTKVVRLEDIKETAGFLVEIMPLMFVPAAVGLTQSWGTLRPILIPVAVILAVSTVAAMAVSGRVTQLVIRREKKRMDQNEGNA